MNHDGIGRARRDAPGWLLRGVVRLLRPSHAEWAEAMRAELAALPPGRSQWDFVLGCAAAVLSPRAGMAAAAGLLLRTAAVIGMFTMAALIPVPAIRLAAILTLALLLAAYGLLRSSAGFGPATADRTIGVVATCGLAVLAVEPILAVNGLRVSPPGGRAGPPDAGHAAALLVVLAVIVLTYLTALLRATARRAEVSAATVATGAAVGAAAAAAWLTVVVLRPAQGSRNGPAVAAILAAGLVAAALTAQRTTTRRDPSGADPGLIAGLLACAGTSLLVGTLIDVLPWTGIFVPTDAAPDHSLSHPPAHLVDPVGVWLLGVVAAVGLAVTVRLRSRHPRSRTESPAEDLAAVPPGA